MAKTKSILIAAAIAFAFFAVCDFRSAAQSASPSAAPLKTLYTCGMHPQVVEEQPGNCPICNMKLVPMDPDKTRLYLEAKGELPAATPAAESTGAPKVGRKILYYRSSMNPTETSPKPGKDSMGMDLVPVYEEAGGAAVSRAGMITVDPATEQSMGVRYATVERGPLEKTIRTVGTVDFSESGEASVSTKINGWVEKVYVDQTGMQVMEGDPLFDFYAPELYSAQQEFIQAAGDASEMGRKRMESARERLRLFDISDAQIDAMAKEKQVRKALTITARRSGVVVAKNIVDGDYLTAGQQAYKIADLTTVWVVGRVFETDLPFVHLGQEAQMRLDYLPGRSFVGRVTYIYPFLKDGTREIPVRVEFHNPGYELKPGMYATLLLKSRLAEEATLAPATAVIDTGERTVAFVSRAPGKFEGRKLTLGPRGDNDQIQILSGLSPGDKVAVSGQFLLDSESRLREAALKMLAPGQTAKTDATTSAAQSMAQSTAQSMAGTAMPGMAMNDEATSASIKYVCPMPGHAGILYDAAGKCPICGMTLVPVPSWQEDDSPLAYYTCPMPADADIRSDKPGKCPRCGMTLIPVTAEQDALYQKSKAADRPTSASQQGIPSSSKAN